MDDFFIPEELAEFEAELREMDPELAAWGDGIAGRVLAYVARIERWRAIITSHQDATQGDMSV